MFVQTVTELDSCQEWIRLAIKKSQRPEGFSLAIGSFGTLATLYLETGCKENHFYSLPFGQAEASIY